MTVNYKRFPEEHRALKCSVRALVVLVVLVVSEILLGEILQRRNRLKIAGNEEL